MVLLVTAAMPATSQQPSAWKNVDSGSVTPVTFSFSGAISMGVYQAGVNWALGQFINLTHDNPVDQATPYRAQKSLPRIDIAALSGASAGNINAVLAAIEYCDATPAGDRAPDASLFWKMWVLSGWDQLMPEGGVLKAGDDPGIFSRRYLAEHVEDTLIAKAMATARHRTGCRIPVGIVVTKVDPVAEAAPGGLTVSTQRFVVPFEIRERDRRLYFEQINRRVDTARALGARIYVGDPRNPLIEHPEIFRVIEASASYPVAFAPITLTYRTPTCFRNPDLANCTAQHAPFMDGGVFDVLPLSVADNLYRIYNETGVRDALEWNGGEQPRLLFVDVGFPRPPLERFRDLQDTAAASKQTQGLDAIARFLKGFIPSARQYERQVFGRTTDTAASLHISTARALPAVSEHLGYFAGFFGRPFREVDFFAGVADGLYYVAHDILCDASRNTAQPGAPAELARRECTERELRDLATNRLELSEVGRHLVNHMLASGEPSISILPAGTAPSSDRERITVLKAIANAEISLWPRNASECKARGLVTLALCGDRFKAFLDVLHRDSVGVARRLRRWAEADECLPGATELEREDCLAERDLWRLVQEPELQMHAYLGAVLRRMRAAEERGQAAAPKFITRAAEATYRSTDYRYRRGWEWDPSSIPPYETAPSGLFSLLPYYVGPTAGIRGWQLGWEPTWHNPPFFPGPVALAFPITSSWIRTAAAKRSHIYLSLTPSLVWRRQSLVNQLQAGWRLTSCVEGNCADDKVHGGWEATAHMASKLRVSVFRHVDPANGRRKTAAAVSLVDVNGILYWLLHR